MKKVFAVITVVAIIATMAITVGARGFGKGGGGGCCGGQIAATAGTQTALTQDDIDDIIAARQDLIDGYVSKGRMTATEASEYMTLFSERIQYCYDNGLTGSGCGRAVGGRGGCGLSYGDCLYY